MKHIKLQPTQRPDMATICRKAVQHYGCQAQLVVAIEELSELTKALTKWMRYGGEDDWVDEDLRVDLDEERADVAIMLEQLNVIFGHNSRALEDKLQRLERTLAEEEHK